MIIAVAVLVPLHTASAQRTSRKPPRAESTAATVRTGGKAPSAGVRGTAALASEISNALASHTRAGQWGAIVVSLTHGDTLFAQNADAMLQPASTMKIYTAAAALEHFGADYSFKTAALTDGSVGADGTLLGNLYLRGVGDPSMGPRFWKDESPMDALAKQVVAAGVKHVRGDIVGDGTAFDDRLVPEGWKTSYLGAAYAARVSALSLNENLLWIVVTPGPTGAGVTLDPPSTTIPIESVVRVVGGTGGRISATRRLDGGLSVKGTIGARSGPLRYSIVAENPSLYTAGAFRAALEKTGITVDGTTRLGATPEPAQSVAAIASPPLSQIVGEMDRESINMFAELLFRATAHDALHQPGSAETGLANLRQFLSQKVGAAPTAVDVADGSGLSVLDRVTPRSMVQLLGYVHRADWGPAFHASLPVDGESGTLKRRAKGSPARGNLHAKTGTTNTVASLGGYVTARNGEVFAFSLIYNGSDRWNAKAAMDQIAVAMADFIRD